MKSWFVIYPFLWIPLFSQWMSKCSRHLGRWRKPELFDHFLRFGSVWNLIRGFVAFTVLNVIRCLINAFLLNNFVGRTLLICWGFTSDNSLSTLAAPETRAPNVPFDAFSRTWLSLLQRITDDPLDHFKIREKNQHKTWNTYSNTMYIGSSSLSFQLADSQLMACRMFIFRRIADPVDIVSTSCLHLVTHRLTHPDSWPWFLG